jgi:hypothetical protein
MIAGSGAETPWHDRPSVDAYASLLMREKKEAAIETRFVDGHLRAPGFKNLDQSILTVTWELANCQLFAT